MESSNKVVEVIDALCEKLGIAIDWTANNVMPYVQTLMQKLVAYEIWTSVAWIIIMFMLTLIIFCVHKYFDHRTNAKSYSDFEEFMYYASHVVFWILAVLSVLVIGVQVFDIIECVVFPEKYVIEYISSLLKSQ